MKEAETTAGTTVSLAYPLTTGLCRGGAYMLSPDLFNAELSVFRIALAGTEITGDTRREGETIPNTTLGITTSVRMAAMQ